MFVQITSKCIWSNVSILVNGDALFEFASEDEPAVLDFYQEDVKAKYGAARHVERETGEHDINRLVS